MRVVMCLSFHGAAFVSQVFRALLSEYPGQVTPVNPKSSHIEQVPCVKSPTELISEKVAAGDLAVSIVTPPAITTSVVRELIEAGVKHIWMQPGAESEEALSAGRAAADVRVIAEGPCVLVELGFSDDM
eukprot:TRINITY_DN6853_c0_g2_i2.p1 TRINITY_DN6853_c0_g2~~TRINITY_DN6853_c0_g2_i2.p1  ORF type:complete len:129 (+),score=11.73 TRINITY_DN6853_c0_g2_i2:131-517(+)